MKIGFFFSGLDWIIGSIEFFESAYTPNYHVVLFCDQYVKLFILYPVLNYFFSNKTIEVFFFFPFKKLEG
jgi:hypothetical protein